MSPPELSHLYPLYEVDDIIKLLPLTYLAPI